MSQEEVDGAQRLLNDEVEERLALCHLRGEVRHLLRDYLLGVQQVGAGIRIVPGDPNWGRYRGTARGSACSPGVSEARNRSSRQPNPQQQAGRLRSEGRADRRGELKGRRPKRGRCSGTAAMYFGRHYPCKRSPSAPRGTRLNRPIGANSRCLRFHPRFQKPRNGKNGLHPEHRKTAVAGSSENGRGGFRTCDLSRVKRDGLMV